MGDLLSAGLSAIGIGGSILGASEQADAAKLTGQANSQMYLYQAGIARYNAQIAKQNAAWARITGEQQASVSGQNARATIGQTRAAQGANGLDINSGSAKAVVDSEHQLASRDQTVIRSNSAQQAYGYDVQAKADRMQARAYDSASSYALQGADVAANASIIGGVTSVASKWLTASQSGSFSGVSKALGF